MMLMKCICQVSCNITKELTMIIEKETKTCIVEQISYDGMKMLVYNVSYIVIC